MHRFSIGHWNERGPIAWLLAPLSLLFAAGVSLRRRAYRAGLAAGVRLPVPTIVVGNFTVGGAGKTPLTIWLVERLRDAGWRPGVVSCGYGGTAPGSRAVTAASDPREDGDEPVLIARRTGAPGFVNPDRAAAAVALLAAHPDVNVIVCDDGLQHLRLGRDIEIAVVDARGYGNGWLMPAGPLRECPRVVDALVQNGGGASTGRQSGLRMHLAFERLYPVHAPDQTIDHTMLAGRRLHAVAGIGAPARFFATLRELGLVATEHAFPDHHPFTDADLRYPSCDLILMTEKDAVKCARFGRTDLVAVQVGAVLDPADESALIRLVTQKLKTPHGRSLA